MHDQVECDCLTCGGRYYADPTRLKHGRQTTCSRECSYRLRAAKLERGEERQCGGCGEVVWRTPGQREPRHGRVFCSPECAYANRKRVVDRPYVRVAVVDYEAATKKAWETRRRNGKPYPDSAREKSRARAIQRLKEGYRVSRFEREAAKVLRCLGFNLYTSVAVRNPDGTFACVFDVLIPSRRLAVECHGTYFHGGRWSWQEPDLTQAKNLRYEERKLTIARSVNLEVRHLWEHEFRKDPVGTCLTVVR